MKQWPKTLYVVVEGKGADEYLLAAETADHTEDGQKVAIYQFIDAKTMRVTHELK